MKNKYPIYVVSKGRCDSRLTVKSLERLGVDYYVVIEEQERHEYERVIDPSKLLTLDVQFQLDYDTLDDLGDTRSKGPGPARNFCLAHSKANGFKRHWVMDDNIIEFYRLHDNKKVRIRTGAALLAAEDFVDRYSNVPVAGLGYMMFCKANSKYPPFTVNTRIYSCLLIENDMPYKWRGRYNEDTILTLDVLSAGQCTIQFNFALCEKVTTQRIKGGNTEEFYAHEGTLPKSKMIADVYPDVAKVVDKFGRIHHHVNYDRFRGNKLIKVDPSKTYPAIDNYGMKLVDVGYTVREEAPCGTRRIEDGKTD